MLPLVVDALRNEVLKRLLEDATKGKTPVDHRISEDVLGELDTFYNKVCPMWTSFPDSFLLGDGWLWST